MSMDVFAIVEDRRCCVCDVLIGTMDIVLMLDTTWVPLDQVDISSEERSAYAPNAIATDLNWTRERVAHKECLEKAIQEGRRNGNPQHAA